MEETEQGEEDRWMMMMDTKPIIEREGVCVVGFI